MFDVSSFLKMHAGHEVDVDMGPFVSFDREPRCRVESESISDRKAVAKRLRCAVILRSRLFREAGLHGAVLGCFCGEASIFNWCCSRLWHWGMRTTRCRCLFNLRSASSKSKLLASVHLVRKWLNVESSIL